MFELTHQPKTELQVKAVDHNNQNLSDALGISEERMETLQKGVHFHVTDPATTKTSEVFEGISAIAQNPNELAFLFYMLGSVRRR